MNPTHRISTVRRRMRVTLVRLRRDVPVVLWACGLSWLLAACGGGQGSAEATSAVPVPPAATNQAPLAAATAPSPGRVGRRVALDGRGSRDPDGGALRLTWRIEVAPVGSRAILRDADTATPSIVPDLIGRYVFGLVVNDGQGGEASTSVAMEASAADVQVKVEQTDALGPFLLTLNGPIEGRVQWFVPGNPALGKADWTWIGTGAADGSGSLRWNGAGLFSNQGLEVVARIEFPGGTLLETSGKFAAASTPSATPSFRAAAFRSGAEIVIDVAHGGQRGLVVRADGQVLARATALNRSVLKAPDLTPDGYRVFLPVDRIPNHATVALEVDDASGARHVFPLRVPLAPAGLSVQVDAPFDGQLAVGQLNVRGVLAGGDARNWRIRCAVNGVERHRQAGPEVSALLDISDLSPGNHELLVEAEAEDGRLQQRWLQFRVVASAAELRDPVARLPPEAQVMARDGQELVYLDGYRGRLMRRSLDGSRVIELRSGIEALQYGGGDRYLVDRGRTYGVGALPDCAQAPCLYEWDREGQVRNLLVPDGVDPATLGYAPGPVDRLKLRDGWAVAQVGRFTVLAIDLESRQVHVITQPIDAGGVFRDFYIVEDVDLFVQGGVAEVYFRTGPNDFRLPPSTTLRWRSNSPQVSVFDRLGPVWNLSTDGRWWAWTSVYDGPVRPSSQATHAGTLYWAPTDGSGARKEARMHFSFVYLLDEGKPFGMTTGGALAWNGASDTGRIGPLNLALPGAQPYVVEGVRYWRIWRATVLAYDSDGRLFAVDPTTRRVQALWVTVSDRLLTNGDELLAVVRGAVYSIAKP